jgi:hypothetical protein
MVLLENCTGYATQNFVLVGSQIQQAENPKTCLDAGKGIKAGTVIGFSECDGSDQQQFGYDSRMKTFYLSKSQEDASMCMDLAGGKAVAYNNIQVWGCNGLDNQKWFFGESPPEVVTLV